MDYDTVELLVGAALAFIPVIVLVFAGLWCLKKARVRMPIYVVAGLLGSLAYGRFAAHLAFIVFPPPFDAALESGGSLDPRGMILLFGAMVGCAAGLITTVVFGVLSLLPQLWRKRAAARGTRRTGGGSGSTRGANAGTGTTAGTGANATGRITRRAG